MTIDHVKLFLLFAGVLLPGISPATPPVHQVSGGGTVEYAGARNVPAIGVTVPECGTTPPVRPQILDQWEVSVR